MNFESLFVSEEKPYKGKSQRDKFLSRLFGIFNEEIIRVWCTNEKSPYTDKGRPTIYDNGKRYTLDFLLEDRDSRLFITEMKCWIEYKKYKYLTLDNKEKLCDHDLSEKPAFQLFLEAAKSPSRIKVKCNEKEVDISGSILVWGRSTEGGSLDVKNNYSIHDVISTESVVADLVKWEDVNYKKLIDQYQLWSDQLFEGLLGDTQKMRQPDCRITLR